MESAADHRGARAVLFGHAYPAVAHGACVVRGNVGVVPLGVLPAVLVGVGCGAVEFDAELVLLVEVVQVDVSRADAALDLPDGPGQTVSALNVADIATFQRRVDAVFALGEGVGEPGAPAGLLASGQPRAEMDERGLLCAEGVADP